MRLRLRLSIGVLLIVGMFEGTNHLLSQGIVTGSITGTVQDPSGAVVKDGSVSAVQNSTNSTSRTRTGPNGAFQLPGLPIGTYTLMVEAPGFVAVKVENVMVQSGTATPVGAVSLSVGGASEAVT